MTSLNLKTKLSLSLLLLNEILDLIMHLIYFTYM